MATLAEQMVLDVDEIFLNVDEHGVDIYYTPASTGVAVARIAVLDFMEDIDDRLFPTQREEIKIATMFISANSTTGIVNPTRSDMFSLNQSGHSMHGVAFVVTKARNDDAGGWYVDGVRRTAVEKTHMGQRRSEV